MSGRELLAVGCWIVTSVTAVHAQEALQLERAGRFDAAARAYRAELRNEPANLSLLMGLERMLQRVGRMDSLRPYVRRAVEADPGSEALREFEFHATAALDGADSVAAVAARWMVAFPRSASPYREWALWLARRGDTGAAQAVLATGRTRTGDAALAQYSAQAFALSGQWREAAQGWGVAVAEDRSLVSVAVGSLRRAPEEQRNAIVGVLVADAESAGRWLAADLLADWGRPEQAWTLLDSALPADVGVAIALLRHFADHVARVRTPAAARARGYAYERLAALETGPAADRARVAAARAFADAGDVVAARRLLSQVGIDTSSMSPPTAAAMATFIQLLADAGQVAEAEERYRAWQSRITPSDGAVVREALAWGWVRRGELGRAEQVLVGDSTVGTQAVMGWVALYRGALGEARARFRAAGPYVHAREEVTRRSGMLVLLERIRAERLPQFGEALLAVARGDTTDGVGQLRVVADALPPQGGRADVLGLAGELAARQSDFPAAESLLLAALAADPEGPGAPGAEYALAKVLVASGSNAGAIRRLEHLILSYPESAVVPQARRLLDRARGMVPKS
jgi:tetratricopeptide (TPR) repeat protein